MAGILIAIFVPPIAIEKVRIMREIWTEIESWLKAGKKVALASVVKVEGSSLRPLGSKMAVTAGGDIAGSVTGGCVEGAVYEEAQAVIQSGIPRLLSYGVPNAAAWEVGLACGGSIQVWVESLAAQPWSSLYGSVQSCLANEQLAALATVVAGPCQGSKLLLWPDGRVEGDLAAAALNQQVIALIAAIWAARDPLRRTFQLEDQAAEVFIDYLSPLPRLVIIGAVHIAIPLVAIAKIMNFHTIVIDARSAFATPERFPHAGELIVDWPATALKKLKPNPSTCIVCLSHDDKLDDPALEEALSSPAGYIGALSSTRTHAQRLQRLRDAGCSEQQLGRIHAPVGLALGAVTPEEIALAIMAEITANSHAVAF
jgi:xanthine dehydrogenase accessory factor